MQMQANQIALVNEVQVNHQETATPVGSLDQQVPDMANSAGTS